MPTVVIATLIKIKSPKEVSCTFKLLLKDAEMTKEQINDMRTKTCSREKIIHFEVIFVKGLKYLDIGVQSFE